MSATLSAPSETALTLKPSEGSREESSDTIMKEALQ